MSRHVGIALTALAFAVIASGCSGQDEQPVWLGLAQARADRAAAAAQVAAHDAQLASARADSAADVAQHPPRPMFVGPRPKLTISHEMGKGDLAVTPVPPGHHVPLQYYPANK